MNRPVSALLNTLWTLILVSTLALLAALLGCEPPKDEEEPAAYYGPAPLTDAGSQDGCIPAAFYGPQPCSDDEECRSRHGEGWFCDSVEYDDGCGGKVTWPRCREESVDAGAPDAGSQDGCIPGAFYGPQPCSDDEECRSRHGEGWFCDPVEYDDGCGGKVTWPQCREQSVDAGVPDAGAPDGCEPAAYYGPPPCESDEECGEGWYCDQDNVVPGGCGETLSWPICRQR